MPSGNILGSLSLSFSTDQVATSWGLSLQDIPPFKHFLFLTHFMKLKLKTYQRRGRKREKEEEKGREMVTTRSSKRKKEETPQNVQEMGQSHSHQLQFRHSSNKALHEAKFYSQVVSARCPVQCPRRAPCVRNKSTAASFTLKKEAHHTLVADGAHMGSPSSEGIHDTQIQAAVHFDMEGSAEIQPMSVAMLPCEAVNDKRVSVDMVSPNTNAVEHFDMEGSGEIQPMSPVLFPCETANDKRVSVNMLSPQTNVIEHFSEHGPEASGNAHSEVDTFLKRQASSFNLTEVAQLLDEDDDCSSYIPESNTPLVTVEGYRVKPNFAPILRDILLKHGDIAANCGKKSIAFRSLLVENVCSIFQILQATEFMSLTPMEIDGFLDLLRDIESNDVEVKWLHQRLHEIQEAKRLLRESSKLKLTKNKSSLATKMIKKEIETHEEEVCKLQEKINSLKAELEVRRADERKLDEVLSHTKSLVKRFYYGSMIDGLL